MLTVTTGSDMAFSVTRGCWQTTDSFRFVFGVQHSCNMAIFLAVGVAILLAIVISIAYALVLRELRKINANLEQFIKLIVDARRREDIEARDFSSNTNLPQRRR
jgi:hypothetical protein